MEQITGVEPASSVWETEIMTAILYLQHYDYSTQNVICQVRYIVVWCEKIVKYMHFNTIKQTQSKMIGECDKQKYTDVVHLTNFKVIIMN